MRSVHADALVGDPGQAGARQVQGRRLASLPEGQRLESLVPRDERVRVASGDVDDGVAGPDRPRAPTLPGRGACAPPRARWTMVAPPPPPPVPPPSQGLGEPLSTWKIPPSAAWLGGGVLGSPASSSRRRAPTPTLPAASPRYCHRP